MTKTIAAKTPKQAWAKFCTLYFGVLKPGRKDYSISKERTRTADMVNLNLYWYTITPKV